MKFKKIIPVLLFACSAAFITPVFASDGNLPASIEKTTKDQRTQELTSRLIEIRNMDKSQLTSTEKKELRKEVKAIRKERKSNGVYLSVGAIIIIALLLIILL